MWETKLLYKALAIGLNHRELVPESDVINRLNSLYEKNPNKDYYVSVFKYKQEHYDTFQKTQTLSGIKNVTTNSIIFDFDSSELQKAKDDTLTLVGRLMQKGIPNKDINVYFSGGKGYHVELFTEKEYNRDEINNIRTSLTSDLETQDPSIKDEQRILRAPLTKHQKSGLFKIPITIDELTTLSPSDIQTLATDLTDFRYELATEYYHKQMSLPADIENLKIPKKIEKKETASFEDRPDFSRNNTGFTNAKYALIEGYFEQGERHEAVVILTATFKALGWHKELTYNNLKATMRLRAQRLDLPDLDQEGKAELYREVESIYSPLWLGGTFSEDTNELLINTKKRYNIEDKFKTATIISINELKLATESFLKNLKDNRIYTGMESLDKNLILTKGMLFGVLGCPGSGKTSFLNVFVENTSKKHGHVLYFSMDMSKDLLGTKIMQRYTGYSLEKLEDMILHGTFDKTYTAAVEQFSEDYKKVGFCFENGYDVAKISEEIDRYQDKIGERLSLVAVDYLEKVNGPYSDDTANSGFVASNLANMAKKHDTCIGLLLQPNKITGNPADQIKSYRSIKGSSKCEQDMRAIIGLWRPGYNPEDFMRDRYLSISILKQNMGKLGKFDYMWDGARGGISEMTSEQKRLFEQFLQELANQKAEKDDF